jgi:thiamine-phosphate pyrophosphorylase
MILSDLIAITDPAISDEELTERAEQVLGSVPRSSVGLQLRDKARAGGPLLALAQRLKVVCERYGAPLYVNDRIDVAVAVGADGVHLGGGSVDLAEARRLLGAEAFVSLAAHRIEQVERAASDGATAALLSPIFATPGKGVPRGTDFLSEARRKAPKLALFALGGIDAGNTPGCVHAGAHGVAAIRAVWHAGNPGRAANSMVLAVRANRKSR